MPARKPRPAPRAKPVPTLGLTHAALRVRDPERSARFYAAVFDSKVTYRDPDHVEVQTPGARDVLAFERGAPPRRPASRRWGRAPHLGFRLRDPGDAPAALAAVRAAGGRVLARGEFSPGHPYVFFLDPDGHEVEVWYE